MIQNRKTLLVLYFSILLTLLGTSQVAGGVYVNVVSNSGFENDYDHWITGSNAIVISYSSYSGDNSMELYDDDGWIEQDVDIAVNDVQWFQFKVRDVGTKNSHVYVTVFYESGYSEKYYETSISFSWMTLSFTSELDSGETIDRIKIEAYRPWWAGGTPNIYVDDVELMYYWY